MKTIETKRIQEITLVDKVYQCEVCNKIFEQEQVALTCERLCKQQDCKHHNFKYNFIFEDPDMEDKIEVYRYCPYCFKNECITLDMHDSKILLDKISNLLKLEMKDRTFKNWP